MNISCGTQAEYMRIDFDISDVLMMGNRKSKKNVGVEGVID